jgi:hypothetical protein
VAPRGKGKRRGREKGSFHEEGRRMKRGKNRKRRLFGVLFMSRGTFLDFTEGWARGGCRVVAIRMSISQHRGSTHESLFFSAHDLH